MMYLSDFKHENMDFELSFDTAARSSLPFKPICKSGLLEMPFEVFSSVCGFLDPAWIFNLGHVCQQTRLALSFERGNKIWYKSLPPSLWKEADKFQCKTEFIAGMATNPPLKQYVSSLPGNTLGLVMLPPLQGFSSKYSQSWSIATRLTHTSVSFPIPQLDDNVRVHTKDILKDSSRPIGCSDGSTFNNLPCERVQALGGPYQPLCDYRAEILGRLKTNQRCYICLCSKNPDGSPMVSGRHRQWGILWCSSCLKEYSIAAGTIQKFVQHSFVTEGFLDCTTFRPFMVGTTQYYYLPEVDYILRYHTGLDARTTLLSHNKSKQKAERERVQTSILERERRLVRKKIVLFAQRIWEGEDPAPEEVVDEQTGKVVAFEPRKSLFSPKLYKNFRERFAPTAKLKDFLFPEYLLDIQPANLPYSPSGGWLQDPTKGLKTFVAVNSISNRHISDYAEEMLSRLTNWRDQSYYRKGMGGYVDSWMNATRMYHITRLEAELTSGLTVNLGHTPENLHGLSRFTRLRTLRAKCGLQIADSAHMHQLPKRPERGPLGASYSLSNYIHLDQTAARAEAKRAEGIKYFNKIIRQTAVACPSTALLFHPMGLEGLVDHMRIGHGELFWESDKFHVIG